MKSGPLGNNRMKDKMPQSFRYQWSSHLQPQRGMLRLLLSPNLTHPKIPTSKRRRALSDAYRSSWYNYRWYVVQ